MAVLPTGIGPVTGYNIERSLRFNSVDTAYLNRTPGSTGNRRTFTFSFWIKRTTLGTGQRIFQSQDDGTIVANTFGILFSADALEIFEYSSAYRVRLLTTQVFRDVSAWYHIVVAIDTTQATASNRAKLYVNGTQVTTFAATTYPSQNTDLFWNVSGQACFIGRFFDGTSALAYLNAYLTEVHFINGYPTVGSTTYNATTWASLDVSTLFGETDASTGVWKPKKYDGTYGTNGFFLKFADNSNTTAATLGKDSSGNGNNWTPNLFSVTAGVGNDSLVDSPTSYGTDTGVGGEVRGNYCTLNPLVTRGGSTNFRNGNLTYTNVSGSADQYVFEGWSTITNQYYECTATTVAASSIYIYAGDNAGYYCSNGQIYIGGSLATTVATYTSGDVLGFAVTVGGIIRFYKNGTLVYTSSGIASGNPLCNGFNSTVWNFNFGQRAFAYTAPSGFKALCTQNLPPVTIGATSTTQANDYFDATTYTGNGTSQSVVNAGGFQPDFVWVKNRTSAYNHILADSVRGTGVYLSSSTTDADQSSTTAVTAFNSNGFTIGSIAGGNLNTNAIVGWQWKGGGTGVTNTAGSITSTVSANTTSGFSIVTYTGTGALGTVGHGLGVTPSMIIVKRRNSTGDWAVYNSNLSSPENNQLLLNSTAAAPGSSTFWGNQPSSSVFSVWTSATTNASGGTFVAYCFAPVAGYSAFGSYTGNGTIVGDGPFIYTGFRPAFVMLKAYIGSGENWAIYDKSRIGYNSSNYVLFPNLPNVENAATTHIDLLSNGFKLRSNNNNLSSYSYIYAAFAEHPFKYSLAR